MFYGTVEEDPQNPGEMLIVFPPGVIEAMGFNDGDAIVWTVEDGQVHIRKQ